MIRNIPGLDLQTLIAVSIGQSVIIGLPLAWYASPRRGSGALWYWALGLLAFSSGSLLLVMRGVIPPIVSIMFGNALVLLAVALLGDVAASLTDRFFRWTDRWFLVLVSAPVLGLLYLFVDNIWPRVAFFATIECLLIGQVAWQLRDIRRKSPQPQHRSLLAFEILMWIFLGEFLFRTVCTLAFTPGGSFFAQALISVAFLFAIVFVTVGSCILIWHELDLKDATMRFLKTTDIQSGIRSRMTFLQLVETRLAQNDASGGGSIALLRVKPAPEGAAEVNGVDANEFYRAVGARIDALLDKADLLARYSDDEFAILFVKKDAARAAQTLDSVFANLHAESVVTVRARYAVTGNAAVVACQAALGAAADFMKALRSELENATAAGMRVATIGYPGTAKRSAATRDTHA